MEEEFKLILDDKRIIKEKLIPYRIFLNGMSDTRGNPVVVGVEDMLFDLCDGYQDVFRRPPTGRVKSIESIEENIGKYSHYRSTYDQQGIVACLKKFNDLIGCRMTVACKEDVKKAFTILKKFLQKFGELRDNERKDNGKMARFGYVAWHYYLYGNAIDTKNKLISSEVLKCEIQVRTLSHDLWSVFTHPEYYKANQKRLPPSLLKEVRSFGKLMDVADDYATLLKNRKVEDADQEHKHFTLAREENVSQAELEKYKSKTLITVSVLRAFYENERLKFSEDEDEKIGQEITTNEWCEIVRSIHSYDIYYLEELIDLINTSEYKYVVDEVSRKLLKDLKVSLTDRERLFCYCQINKQYIKSIIDDSTLAIQNLYEYFCKSKVNDY